MLALFASTAGLLVGSPLRVPASSRTVAPCMISDIVTTAVGLQGPVMYWGADGVALGHEESDIKGYDNFGKLCGALTSFGLVDALKGPGPFTVFAPTDAAIEAFTGEITADILKYHVVPGKVMFSSITGDLKTLQGSTLTYGRRFRKTFLDNAMVGISSSGASKGQVYPVDVECTNGVIHAIDVVLVPGAYKP